jgi:hypothetical protein
MKFEPKTAKEIDELGLLPVGEYDFLVHEAEDTQSKKGNDMAVVKLLIDGPSGEIKIVDYLVAIDSMAYKIRHFAESVGLLAEYEKGEMPAEIMVGKTGKCKLVVAPAKDGYRAKNTVSDYLSASNPGAPKAEVIDDEIPF